VWFTIQLRLSESTHGRDQTLAVAPRAAPGRSSSVEDAERKGEVPYIRTTGRHAFGNCYREGGCNEGSSARMSRIVTTPSFIPVPHRMRDSEASPCRGCGHGRAGNRADRRHAHPRAADRLSPRFNARRYRFAPRSSKSIRAATRRRSTASAIGRSALPRASSKRSTNGPPPSRFHERPRRLPRWGSRSAPLAGCSVSPTQISFAVATCRTRGSPSGHQRR
jgi:hypothetical protein